MVYPTTISLFTAWLVTNSSETADFLILDHQFSGESDTGGSGIHGLTSNWSCTLEIQPTTISEQCEQLQQLDKSGFCEHKSWPNFKKRAIRLRLGNPLLSMAIVDIFFPHESGCYPAIPPHLPCFELPWVLK